MSQITGMPLGKLVALMGAVVACHLAAISVVAEKSTVKNGFPAKQSYIQVVPAFKPVVKEGDLPNRVVTREPDSFASGIALAAAQRPLAKKQSHLETDALDGKAKITFSNALNQDSTPDTADDEAVLGELLRTRLPYITSLVTLEFLIGADGYIKQVSCLEDSCSDAVIACLNSLIDLQFPFGADLKMGSEYRKIIEVEPFLVF